MTTGSVRLVALVRAKVLHPRTRHSIGLPIELDVAGERHPLPLADVLLIEQADPASVFLYRFTRSGDSAGDTWHASADEALRQADYEYGSVLSEWMPIPEDVTDARGFAIAAASGKSDSLTADSKSLPD